MAFEPVGFPLPASPYPEKELAALAGQKLIFLGGISGRLSGELQSVGPVDSHPHGILVSLVAANLIIGE